MFGANLDDTLTRANIINVNLYSKRYRFSGWLQERISTWQIGKNIRHVIEL